MPTTHAPVYLPPLTLVTAEANLARHEAALLLAQRGDDAQATDRATYRRDHAAKQCAMLRAGRL